MDREISLQVNGAAHWLSVDTRTTLLGALPECLGPFSSAETTETRKEHLHENCS
jgi:hypothetical protein